MERFVDLLAAPNPLKVYQPVSQLQLPCMHAMHACLCFAKRSDFTMYPPIPPPPPKKRKLTELPPPSPRPSNHSASLPGFVVALSPHVLLNLG